MCALLKKLSIFCAIFISACSSTPPQDDRPEIFDGDWFDTGNYLEWQDSCDYLMSEGRSTFIFEDSCMTLCIKHYVKPCRFLCERQRPRSQQTQEQITRECTLEFPKFFQSKCANYCAQRDPFFNTQRRDNILPNTKPEQYDPFVLFGDEEERREPVSLPPKIKKIIEKNHLKKIKKKRIKKNTSKENKQKKEEKTITPIFPILKDNAKKTHSRPLFNGDD